MNRDGTVVAHLSAASFITSGYLLTLKDAATQ